MNAFKKLFLRNKKNSLPPPEEVNSSNDGNREESCGECEERTALTNQPGQLCSVLDGRYVMTTVDHVPLLVPVESEVVNKWKLNHLIWDKKNLHLHKHFPDGTSVCFDAVRASESTGYQIIFMWIGSKPDKIVLPANGSALLIKSHADVLHDILNDSKSLTVTLHNEEKSLSMPSEYWHDGSYQSVHLLESKESLKLSVLEMLSEKDGVFNYFLKPFLYLDAPPEYIAALEPMEIYLIDGNVLQPSSSAQVLYLDAPVLRDNSSWQLSLGGEKINLSQCYQFCSDVRHTVHSAHVLHDTSSRLGQACLIGSNSQKITPSISLPNVSLTSNVSRASPEKQNNSPSNDTDGGLNDSKISTTAIKEGSEEPLMKLSACSEPNLASSSTACNNPESSQLDANLDETTKNELSHSDNDIPFNQTAPSNPERESELSDSGSVARTLASQGVTQTKHESECKPLEPIAHQPTDAESEKSPNFAVDEDVKGNLMIDTGKSCGDQSPVRNSPTLETTAVKESQTEEHVGKKDERSETGSVAESGALPTTLDETPPLSEKFSDIASVEVSGPIFTEMSRTVVSDDEDVKSVEYKSASEGSLIDDSDLMVPQKNALHHKAEESLPSGQSPAFDADPSGTTSNAEKNVASIIDAECRNESPSNDDGADATAVLDPYRQHQSEDNGSEVDPPGSVNFRKTSCTEETAGSVPDLALVNPDRATDEDRSDCAAPSMCSEVATAPSSLGDEPKLEMEESPSKLVDEGNTDEIFVGLSTLLAMFRTQEDMIQDDPIVKCLDNLYEYLMKKCPKPACFGSSFACTEGEDIYVVPNCKEFRGFAVADDVFAVASSGQYALVKCKLQNLYILCPVGELPSLPRSENVSVLYYKASLSSIVGVNVAYGVLAWSLDDPPVLLHHSCEVHSLTVGIKARMDHIAAYSFTNQGVPLQGCTMGTNVLPPLSESILASLEFSVLPARIVAFQQSFLHVYIDSGEVTGHSKCHSKNVFLRRVKRNIAKILEGQSMNTNVFGIMLSNELVCVYDELAPGTFIHFCSEHQPTLLVSSDDRSSLVSSSSDALALDSATNSPDHGFADANANKTPCDENTNSHGGIPASVSVASLDSGKHTLPSEKSTEELKEYSDTDVKITSESTTDEVIEVEVNLETNVVKYMTSNASQSAEQSLRGSSGESQSGTDRSVSEGNLPTIPSTEQQKQKLNYSNSDEISSEVSKSKHKSVVSPRESPTMQAGKLSHAKTRPCNSEKLSIGETGASKHPCEQMTGANPSEAPTTQEDVRKSDEVSTEIVTEKIVIQFSKPKPVCFVCSIQKDQLMNNCALLKTMAYKLILPYFNFFNAKNALKIISENPKRKFSVNVICRQLEKPLFLKGRLVTHVAILGYVGTKPECAANVINYWSLNDSISHSDLFEMLALYLPVDCQNRVVLGKVVMMGQEYGVLRFCIVPCSVWYYVRFEAKALRYASDNNVSVSLGDCFMKTCFASIRLDETAPPGSEIRFLSSDVLVGSLQQLRACISDSTDVTLLKHVLFFQGENDGTPKADEQQSSDSIWKTEVERMITTRVDAASAIAVVEPVVKGSTKCSVLDEELPVVHVSSDYVVLKRKNDSLVVVPVLNVVEWIMKDSSSRLKIDKFLMGKFLRVLFVMISEEILVDQISVRYFGLAAYATNSLPAVLDTVSAKWRSEVNIPAREVEALLASFSSTRAGSPSVPVNATVMYATESNGILSFVDYQRRHQYACVSRSDISFYLETKPITEDVGCLALTALIGKPLKALVTYRSRLLLLSYETCELKISTLHSFLPNADAVSRGQAKEGTSSPNAGEALLASEFPEHDSAKTTQAQKSPCSEPKHQTQSTGLDAKLETKIKSPEKKGNCAPKVSETASTSATVTTPRVVKDKAQNTDKSPTPVVNNSSQNISSSKIVKMMFERPVRDVHSMLQELGLGECTSSSKLNRTKINHYVVRAGEFYPNFVLFVTKVGRMILPFKNYFSDFPLQKRLEKHSLSLMCVNLPFSLQVGPVVINSYAYFAFFEKKPMCGKVFEKFISEESESTLHQLVIEACARISSSVAVLDLNKAKKLPGKASPPSVSAVSEKPSSSGATSTQAATAASSLKEKPKNSLSNTNLVEPVATVAKDAGKKSTQVPAVAQNASPATAKAKKKAKKKNKAAEKESVPSTPSKKTDSTPNSSASAAVNSNEASAVKKNPTAAAAPKTQPPKTSGVAQNPDEGKDKSGAAASGISKSPTPSSIKSRTSAVFSKTTVPVASKLDADTTVKSKTSPNSGAQSKIVGVSAAAKTVQLAVTDPLSEWTSNVSASSSAASSSSSTSASITQSPKSSTRSSPALVPDALSQSQYLLMPEPWEELESAVIVENYSDFSRMKTREGMVLMFQPKQCYLYGVSLDGLQLWHVLVQDLPVRYSFLSPTSPGAAPAVARVYVGAEDVSRTPPLILQQCISDWCEEKCVSAADTRLLAYRAALMKGLV